MTNEAKRGVGRCLGDIHAAVGKGGDVLSDCDSCIDTPSRRISRPINCTQKDLLMHQNQKAIALINELALMFLN
jgi:hypothetical protein